ncbi:MAG TPA: hypothetical protein PKB03_04390, partial [Baekduia sp.]|nr:hypothetical protein [Baekduia sp.]
NLDSLDRHDTGVPSFHAAEQGSGQRFFFPLLGTWFDWDRRSRHDTTDPVKRLYIREVRPAYNRDGALLVAVRNRELHAERDTAQRRFTHVDGKMCEDAADGYAPSATNPGVEPGKFTRSRKLWRVDGDMSDEEWAALVGLHFRGNELIAEHFAELFPGTFAAS